MADDAAVPEETQETPQPAVPDSQEGTPTEQAQTDWEQRYKNLEADHTRAAQEAAQLTQYRDVVQGLSSEDPEIQQWALDALGLEAAMEDSELEDPYTALQSRLDQHEQFLLSQQQESQQQAQLHDEYAYIEQAVTTAQEKLGRQFTEDELHFLGSYAAANRTDDGAPGIEAALQRHANLEKQFRDQWAASKRTSTPANGQAAEESPLGLDATPAQRQAAMMSQLHANE